MIIGALDGRSIHEAIVFTVALQAPALVVFLVLAVRR